MKPHQAPAGDPESEAFLPGGEESRALSHKSTTLKSLRQEHLTILYGTNVVLLVALIWSLATRSQFSSEEFYSPARHIVKYEQTFFLDNVDQFSEFQGPPDDVKDDLWDKLYRNTSTTVVKAEQARHLPDHTMVLPGTDGDGIISLEVFHQLHCLNSLRKSLYPERFPDYSVFYANGTRKLDLSTHQNHCVDRIRQAIQCASNLGATHWNWNKTLGEWRINMTTTQTCRNFEDIRQWAVARNLLDWDERVPSHLTGAGLK